MTVPDSAAAWTNKAEEHPPRPLMQAFFRGLAGRCPHCGQGRMFRAYLKVADTCNVCGEDLHHHRADDAPAYFVIVILGHILVPLVVVVESNFEWSYALHAVVWPPLTFALALALLTPVKGAIVAVQWALRMHGFGDPEAPATAH